MAWHLQTTERSLTRGNPCSLPVMGCICLEPWRRAWGLSTRRNGGFVAATGARYFITHSTQNNRPELRRVLSGWGEHLRKNGACQDCHHAATDAREDRKTLLPTALRLTATTKPSSVAESGTYREIGVENIVHLPLSGGDTTGNGGLSSTGSVSHHPREAEQRSDICSCKEGMLPEGQCKRLHLHLQGRSSSMSSVASFASLLLRLKLLPAFTDSISSPLSQFGSNRFGYGFRGIFERCTVARGVFGYCAQNFLTPFVGSSSHCSFAKGSTLSSTRSRGLACCAHNFLTPFVASSHCSFPPEEVTSSPAWFRGLVVPSKPPCRSAERMPFSTASEKQQKASENDKAKEGPRTNFQIKAPLVRLVGLDEDGNASHEVVSRAVALMKSKRAGLDLVEINPSADPPVCKILDYSKYRYELRKKEKDARKRQVEKRRVDAVKNVQIGSRTEQRDLELKVKQAGAHLLQGHRVKLMLIFRSGDRGKGVGAGMLEKALGMLEDVGIVEVAPKDVGQHAITILRPKAAASAAPGSSPSSISSSS